MSNKKEIQKELRKVLVERLKKALDTFMAAKTGDEVHISAAELQEIFWEIQTRYESEIGQVATKAINEIHDFWLHDTTRAQVCEWIKSVIYKLERI